jgi:CubicO group peptidase (beta-lactamase class C family)
MPGFLARAAEAVSRGELAGVVTLRSTGDREQIDTVGEATFGGPPVRSDTLFRLASLTKPIAAAAAMILVDEHVVRLDDPVEPWLPELADRRVLRSADAPLYDTVPAPRSVTLRDLLTCRVGYGIVLPMDGGYPIQAAMAEAGIAPAAWPPDLPADELMRRFGALPLAHAPGQGWLYHSGFDLLAVLIARAAMRPFGTFLRERLFEPLGMRATGFTVPTHDSGRVATCYAVGPESGRPIALDDVGRVTRPPTFESGGTGLIGTIVDYGSFCRMLLNRGRVGRGRILSARSVDEMITDQLTPRQRAAGALFLGPFLGPAAGWGFGLGIVPRDAGVPRGFGWAGGYGTMAWVDPYADLIGIAFTQHMLETPAVGTLFRGFLDDMYREHRA